jgi:hypothetical protein
MNSREPSTPSPKPPSVRRLARERQRRPPGLRQPQQGSGHPHADEPLDDDRAGARAGYGACHADQLARDAACHATQLEPPEVQPAGEQRRRERAQRPEQGRTGEHREQDADPWLVEEPGDEAGRRQGEQRDRGACRHAQPERRRAIDFAQLGTLDDRRPDRTIRERLAESR